MYILVTADGEASLQDIDNMSCFSIREQQAGAAAMLPAQFASAAADDDHYWLDADAVAELCGRLQDQSWLTRYRNMLAGVAAYGYYDEANNKVKAHVERADDED